MFHGFYLVVSCMMVQYTVCICTLIPRNGVDREINSINFTQEMLKAVGLDREYAAGSRHSVSSASSVARSARRYGRQQQQHRHHRELKYVYGDPSYTIQYNTISGFFQHKK